MKLPKNQNLLKKIWYSDSISKFTEADDYGSASKLLLEQQKKDWPKLAEGYKSLDLVKTRDFNINDITIKIQFNPGRIISTSARVDDKSIEKRECFLCTENLPQAQNGILYRNEYLILCNPFPIFPEHFTIPNINHFPQRIKDVYNLILSLSRSMNKYYTVFYNGPRCGASAPDHLHFQSGSKFFMPIEKEFNMLKERFGEKLIEEDEFSIYGIDDGIRKMITFEGETEEILLHYFNDFYDLLCELSENKEEPMMNIISNYDPEYGWRIIIFIRSKHRPSHYFAQGDKNILISPAAVDLGGVCITPLEKDFNKITKDDIIDIFHEVFIGKEQFEYLKIKIKDSSKSKN